MRYITIPEAFAVVDPVTDEPMDKNGKPCALADAERISFAKFVKLLCVLASQGQSPPDPLTLIDIRNKAATYAPAQTWDCDDAWHKILADQCKGLRGLPPQTTFSAEEHLRAIVDAPTKAPATAS